MAYRIRLIVSFLTLGLVLSGRNASAQKAPSPLAGVMVSGGVATLRAEGGGVWYPEVHLTGTGRSGWGGDLGVGVYSGDGSGVLIDASVAHIFASPRSRVGFMLLLGPAVIFGEGGTAFGAALGGALLVRLAPHFGLRIDASPRIYIFDGSADPGITLSFSLTSLPGAWRGK